jgi:serine/threonine protein kinase
LGWTIERHLGTGPVCDTWLASKPAAEGAVVRVLREPLAADPIVRAEWIGASWAVNRFAHPRVPRMLQDGADARGLPVVVRRWARGTPLERVVRRGVLATDLALRLAEQILDALELAHAHGVVHGAITPSNVIVTPRGTARLVDFAIAPGSSRGATALADARRTPFAAPEGRPSELADVWSVGACLHFALTGEPPGSSRPDGLVRGLTPDGAPGREVAAIVRRALADEPADRYASAYAMRAEIHALLMDRVGSAPRPVLVPESSHETRALDPEPTTEIDAREELAAAVAALRSESLGRPRSDEWRGNLVLLAAIAFAMAFATYVLVREQLADGVDLSQPALLLSPR